MTLEVVQTNSSHEFTPVTRGHPVNPVAEKFNPPQPSPYQCFQGGRWFQPYWQCSVLSSGLLKYNHVPNSYRLTEKNFIYMQFLQEKFKFKENIHILMLRKTFTFITICFQLYLEKKQILILFESTKASIQAIEMELTTFFRHSEKQFM